MPLTHKRLNWRSAPANPVDLVVVFQRGSKIAEYTQAIELDGAAILKDGEPMAVEEILDMLRRVDKYENQIYTINRRLGADWFRGLVEALS